MYQRGTIFPMHAGYATRKIKFTWPKGDCSELDFEQVAMIKSRY